jgi:hypothetical protein
MSDPHYTVPSIEAVTFQFNLDLDLPYTYPVFIPYELLNDLCQNSPGSFAAFLWSFRLFCPSPIWDQIVVSLFPTYRGK